MKITKNINLNELVCRCGCATPQDISYRLMALAFMLQRIRDHFAAPVYINSAYRCQSHNSAVGGASRSYHMEGIAADIRVKDVHPQVVYKAVLLMMSKGLILSGGVKCYPAFVHYDMRGSVTKF